MSANCNYCMLKSIQKRARKDKKKVMIVPAKWGMGGVEVYIVSKHEKPSDSNHVAWLMSVTPYCTC